MLRIILALLMLTNISYALKVAEDKVTFEKLDDHQECFSKYNYEYCYDALNRWVEKNPKDTFKAGKITRLAMRPSAAIPFFSKAFENKTADCSDRDIATSVISALELTMVPDKVSIEQAKKIGFDLCYKEMRASILNSATLGSNTFKNACKDLVAKGDLKGLKATACKNLKGDNL